VLHGQPHNRARCEPGNAGSGSQVKRFIRG
jgi:hypothetical protein